MLSSTSSECQCGFMGIVAGKSPVRMQGRQVIACEMCEPELLNAADEDTTKVRSLVVQVHTQIWSKPDGSFSIYKVINAGPVQPWMPDLRRPFSLKGPIGTWTRGDTITVDGTFDNDPKYGLQFTSIGPGVLAVRENEKSLIAFLAELPQIGEIRAKEILRTFGGLEPTTQVLEKEPEKLLQISGLTTERIADIVEEYNKISGFREFRLWMHGLGQSETTIADALARWGEDAKDIIEDDPFMLLELEKSSFDRADQVRTKLGQDVSSPLRIAAAVRKALHAFFTEGHCFVPKATCSTSAQGRLAQELRKMSLTDEMIESGLALLQEGRTIATKRGRLVQVPPSIVIDEEDDIWLEHIHGAEVFVAEKLLELMKPREGEAKESFAQCFSWYWDFEPAEAQRAALTNALEHQVSVLHGSPGSGKSASVSAIIEALESEGEKILLVAPTGKAAMRMTELTKRPASTIHRLIAETQASSEDQIDCSVLCLDESSMISIELLADLLRCVRPKTKLIFVGDVDQLPSIDSGRVLFDLLMSDVPSTRLTQIFRQQSYGQTKRIPEFAKALNDGVIPDLSVKGTDCNFSACDDPEEMRERIVELVRDILPAKYGFKPKEIQVLAPQQGELGKKNWPIGIRALNAALQEALNPLQSEQLYIGDGYSARVGDKVAHTKNNKLLQTMNGESGIVVQVSLKPIFPSYEVITSDRTKLKIGKFRGIERATTSIIVDYSGRLVGYTKEEAKELALNYCMSVHRSQGQGFTAVIFPVHKVNAFMLTRNLVYTALTRAEKYALLIGEKDALAAAVKNLRGLERNTKLQQRLRQKAN